MPSVYPDTMPLHARQRIASKKVLFKGTSLNWIEQVVGRGTGVLVSLGTGVLVGCPLGTGTGVFVSTGTGVFVGPGVFVLIGVLVLVELGVGETVTQELV